MADRTLIKIFKIPKSKIDTLNASITRTSDNFLVNVDTTGIYSMINSSDKQIDLSIANLPANVYGMPEEFREGKYTIQYDENGNAFVIIGNQKFFINAPSQIASTLAEEVYTFHVNPDRVTPSYSKLQTEVRTLSGWEIQHWGNQLTELKVDGKTGSMHSSTNQGQIPLSEAPSIYESTAWKKLVSLRKLYEQDQSRRNRVVDYLLGMTFYDGLYVGYFVNFSGPVADKDAPYIMTYSFTFKVVETIYSSGEVSIPSDNNLPEVTAGQQNLIR